MASLTQEEWAKLVDEMAAKRKAANLISDSLAAALANKGIKYNSVICWSAAVEGQHGGYGINSSASNITTYYHKATVGEWNYMGVVALA